MNKLNLYITKDCPDPIYWQVKRHIKSQILLGNLADEEVLPTPAELAKDLDVPRFDITRAYSDLLTEGFLITAGNNAPVVSYEKIEQIKETYKQEWNKKIKKIISEYISYGMMQEEMEQSTLSAIQEAYADYDEGNKRRR